MTRPGSDSALVMISAAEPSADRLGAAVLRALAARTTVTAMGMGGPALRSAGQQAWHDASALSVVGLFEVLRHLPRLYGLHRDLVRRTVAAAPKVALLIDAPDFHLRVARGLKRQGIPVVLLAPPAVWASRPHRVRKYAAAVDHVLTLFPFEVDAWSGVPVTWVGHPVVDEVGAARPPPPDPTRIALLPGSRPTELRRHGPVLAGAARILLGRGDARSFVVPLARPEHRPAIRTFFEDLPVDIIDGPSALRRAIFKAAAAFVASGTATLETAVLGCPQVVFYRLHPATYAVARRLIQVEHWALPNILVGRRAVPELIQTQATPKRLADAMTEVLAQAEASSLSLAAEVRARLGPSGAAERAADLVRSVARLST